MKAMLRKFLLGILNDSGANKVTRGLAIEEPSSAQAKFRVGVVNATNGRILEMSTFKSNPHGPDWTTELFIVPEDQTLGQALTTILTLKGLDK